MNFDRNNIFKQFALKCVLITQIHLLIPSTERKSTRADDSVATGNDFVTVKPPLPRGITRERTLPIIELDISLAEIHFLTKLESNPPITSQVIVRKPIN